MEALDLNNERKDLNEEKPPKCNTFQQMGVVDNILRAILEYGFVTPSRVQQKAAVSLCSGRDMLIHADSGTGKTSTYAIAVLQRMIHVSEPPHQALILVPTRELAQSVHHLFRALATYLKVHSSLWIGAHHYVSAGNRDDKEAQVIVATPRGVQEHIDMGWNVNSIRILILDELDELCSHGWEELVHVLLGQVPSTAQLAFFASKKEDIRKFSEKYLKNPVVINALRKSFSLNSLKNFYVDVEHHYELDTLIDLLEHTDDNGLSLTAFTCVVVCNTRRKAGWLATKLSAADFDACACVENVHLMDLANSNIFVTTELCLRSIPFQDVSSPVVLINYDMPLSLEAYAQRVTQLCKNTKLKNFSRIIISLKSYTDSNFATSSSEFEELPMDFLKNLQEQSSK